ncbi:MAG: FAD-binding oxidoreductase [Gammaproteobacteria bacterium]|nr:FAD-binding oxidoreductase [Gammaproteobacteria bacterium]
MTQPVAVLGAGIVGISCALELQRRGFQVKLLDRRGPAQETSLGNAGLLSYSNITPIASPVLLARMPRLILNLDDDFLLHYPHMLSLLPWLLRFVLRCRRKTYLSDGAAMADLTLASIEIHKRWIAEADAGDLLNRVGGLKLYRHRQSFLRDRLERELLERCGVKHTVLSPDQAYELEPDLKRIFAQAVLIDETISIRNPEKLCQAYAQMFVDAGGHIGRVDIQFLRPTNDGWEVVTDQGCEKTPRVVVCMGAWTPGLIGQLGYTNPLAIERGYHSVFAASGEARLTRPVFDVDGSYVMAPMEAGLRVSSGSNLVRRETRSDPRQLVRVTPRVREAFPIAEELSPEPWMGRRPTVPDTLPIIGPAPRHQNLWLAFAHSHMGLTTGPITGQLIANFITGSEQPFPVSPCDPARYL